MLPHVPEDWPGLFSQHLNAGDLDSVMELYEPNAHFVLKSGETLVGRDRIRNVLAGLIQAETRLHGEVLKTINTGEIALLYTDFHGTTVDASGMKVEVHNNAIEVLRLQSNGTWKLIAGDPNVRG
jgi:ketosteroid isomerase-like protein